MKGIATKMSEVVELVRLYLEEGFKLMKCIGENPRLNRFIKTDAKKAYKTAMIPLVKNFTNADFEGINAGEAVQWIEQKGYIGCVIPRGNILLGLNNDYFKIAYLESICAKLGIDPSIHNIASGKQYLFKLSKDLPAFPKVYTKSGIKVTYKVGGKGFIMLTPSQSKSDWELWQPLQELPELPEAFYPYDKRDKYDVLNCLSWEVGDAWRNGLLDTLNDIFAEYMSLLIECYISPEKIHEAFKMTLLDYYDKDITQENYRKAEEKMRSGEPVIRAGSFIHQVTKAGLTKVAKFAKELLQLAGSKLDKDFAVKV